MMTKKAEIAAGLAFRIYPGWHLFSLPRNIPIVEYPYSPQANYHVVGLKVWGSFSDPALGWLQGVVSSLNKLDVTINSRR
jgi:hypothetical protein